MNSSPNFEKPLVLPDIPFLGDRGKLNPQTRGQLDSIRSQMKQAADTHAIADSRLAAEGRNILRKKEEITQLKKQLVEASALIEVRKKELTAKRAEMASLLQSTNIDIRNNAEESLKGLVEAQNEVQSIIRRIESDIRRKEIALSPLLKLESDRAKAQAKYEELHKAYVAVSSQALAEFARATHAIETISLDSRRTSLEGQLAQQRSGLHLLTQQKAEAQAAVNSAKNQLAQEERRLSTELGATNLEIRQNAATRLEGVRRNLQEANRILRSIDAQIRRKQVPIEKLQSDIAAIQTSKSSQDSQLLAYTTPKAVSTAPVAPRNTPGNHAISANNKESLSARAPASVARERSSDTMFSIDSGISIAKNINPSLVSNAIQKYMQEKGVLDSVALTATQLRKDLGFPNGTSLVIGPKVVARINSATLNA